MQNPSLQDKWAVVDQFAYGLAGVAKRAISVQELGQKLDLSQDGYNVALYEKNFKIACKNLIAQHGHELTYTCKITLGSKEKSPDGQPYRKGEYRLYMGDWGCFVILLAPTEDKLSIDERRALDAFYVIDDSPLRNTDDEAARKVQLKELIQERLASQKPAAPKSAPKSPPKENTSEDTPA